MAPRQLRPHAPQFAPSLAMFTHVPLQQLSPLVQSASALHCTQLPLPSQSWPPPSVHAVPSFALPVRHWPPVHVTVWHFVVGDVQSLCLMHATQSPLPSQNDPFPVEQTCPAPRSVRVQHPLSQVRLMQSLEGFVQSETPLQVCVHVVMPPVPPEVLALAVELVAEALELVTVAVAVLLELVVPDPPVPEPLKSPRTCTHDARTARSESRAAEAAKVPNDPTRWRCIRTSPRRRRTRGRRPASPNPASRRRGARSRRARSPSPPGRRRRRAPRPPPCRTCDRC